MSIKNKIIGYYSITMVVVFTLFVIISGVFISRYMYEEIKSDLYEEARVTSLILNQSLSSSEELNQGLLASIITTLKKTTSLKLDSQSGYFFYSEREKTFAGANRSVPDIAENAILESLQNKSRDVSFTYNGVRYIGILYNPENIDLFQRFPIIAKNNGVSFYLFIYIKDAQVRQLISSIISRQLFFIILALVFVLISGILVTNSITKPLRRLHAQTLNMAKRNFDLLPEMSQNDEIGQLAESINHMAAELKNYEQTQNLFLQNASHELKTPLMSIKGYAEGMIDGLVEKNEENLNIIVEESDRLRKIVEGISYLSKIESKNEYLTYEICDINEVVSKAILKVSGLAYAKKIELKTEVIAEAECLLDEEKILQALINIYSNGIRYAKSMVKTSINRESNNVIITITDDGEGLNIKDLPFVFERFYKGADGENGLGLAITKAIIQKHNGTVKALNDPLQGASFIIKLPMKEESYDKKK
ncbi:MAG: HAMP domain-containing histidine kinase [Clostridia bacterium]|nr:HAMP domain-containing histidine kinase [Clostridia bacterium]